MTTVLTVLLAVLVFGMLILVHELGHYLFARIFDVHILEFSVGMGPKLLQKVSKKTGIAYSLRALPFGGYVSMVGENEESDDPRALPKKPVWQRIVITAAGAAVNILVGFLLAFLMVALMPKLGGTTVAEFNEGSTSVAYLQEGDRILSVAGHSVYTHMDLGYEIARMGVEPVDVEIERNGERITVQQVVFPVSDTEGTTFGDMDFMVYAVKRTPSEYIKQSFAYCRLPIKQVWESIYDLLTGRYSVKSVSGPVGISSEIGQAAQVSIQQKNAFSFLYIVIIIAINLGVMNLLPLPALDGGHLLFYLIELIFRKKVPKKIEDNIHLIGIMLLFLLMIVITMKDIVTLF